MATHGVGTQRGMSECSAFLRSGGFGIGFADDLTQALFRSLSELDDVAIATLMLFVCDVGHRLFCTCG